MLKMRTVELAVGTLVIAGLVSLLMLALQVSGLSDFYREESGYKVRAEFTNIGGLKVRGKVAVAGVMVGRVVDIQLDPKTFYAIVEMSIDPKRSEKFPSDTQAQIMTAGLLGDNYVALLPGFNDSAFLAEGSVIPVESTYSALALEGLISKFVGAKASEGDKAPAKSASDSNKTDKANLPDKSSDSTVGTKVPAEIKTKSRTEDTQTQPAANERVKKNHLNRSH